MREETLCDLCGVRIAGRQCCTSCVDWLTAALDRQETYEDPNFAIKSFCLTCAVVGVLGTCVVWLVLTY